MQKNNHIEIFNVNILLLVVKKKINKRIETNFEFIKKKLSYEINITNLIINLNNEDKFQAFIQLENKNMCEKAIKLYNKSEDYKGYWYFYYIKNKNILNEFNSNIIKDLNIEKKLNFINKLENDDKKLNEIKILINNYPTLIKKYKDTIEKIIENTNYKIKIIYDIDLNNLKFYTKNSNLIIIKNIDNIIKNKYIINLFNCFGNIKYLVRNLKNKIVYLEYTSNKGPINSLKLQNWKFFKKKLKIDLSYNQINIDYFYIKSKLSNNYKIKFIKTQLNRFNSKHKIKINNPNNILLISNISQKINEFKIYKFFNFNNNINKIKEIKKNKYKTKLYNIEINSISNAIEILTSYHNMYLENNWVKISFSFAKMK